MVPCTKRLRHYGANARYVGMSGSQENSRSDAPSGNAGTGTVRVAMEIVPIDQSDPELRKVADAYNEIISRLSVMQRVELQWRVETGGISKGLEYLLRLVEPE